MTTALRLLCCVFLFAGLPAHAQAQSADRPANQESAPPPPQLPQIEFENLTSVVVPAFRSMLDPTFLPPPLMFADSASAALYRAISKRLGVRYRFFGADDRGYDCSGFVWRVFKMRERTLNESPRAPCGINSPKPRATKPTASARWSSSMA